MNDDLEKAAENQAGNNEIYYYSEPVITKDKKGQPSFQLVVAGTQNASDFVTLMRNLPELFQDHGELSHILGNLLSLLTHQQAQISSLEKKIEEMVRANIAIRAQENVNNILYKLASEGCDVSRP